MFLTNTKDKLIQKSLYNVDILIHPLIVLQIRIVFWVVVAILEI